MTIFDEPVELKTASAPRGPTTKSATNPDFSPSYEKITLAIPSAKPGKLPNEVPGAYSLLRK